MPGSTLPGSTYSDDTQMKLAELSSRAAAPVLRNPDTVVVIPIGSTEQHGPVGPLGTDWIIPEWIAGEMEKRTDVLVTPVIPFGVATHHTSFAGTIDMGLETMISVMRGVFESLARHGARRFIVVNGHGGNDPAIEKAGLEIARSTGALVTLLNWWAIAPQLNPEWVTGHGDAQEVSAVMHIRPDLIDLSDCPETEVKNLSADFAFTHLGAVRYRGAVVKIVRDLKLGIPCGGFGGLPSARASREWGSDMMTAIVDYFCAFAEDFRKLPLGKPNEATAQ